VSGFTIETISPRLSMCMDLPAVRHENVMRSRLLESVQLFDSCCRSEVIP